MSEEDAPFRAGVNHDFLRSIVAALKSGGARIRMRLDHQRKSGLHFDVGDGARRALLMPMVWLDA